MSDERPTVAVFRPDDERLETAVTALADAGVDPLADPMLAIEPTGATPAAGEKGVDRAGEVDESDGASRVDAADVVILTSKTGVELTAEAGWKPGPGTSIVAIGAATADALREAGYAVDLVPEEYTSQGLVDVLAPRIERGDVEEIEVARSDHGSDVLLDGLAAAGATVHETVLYELRRPPDAGESTELASAGELDGVLFTSSLTVEHFLAAAADRGIEAEAHAGLTDAVVGAIGEPTAETARERGIGIDVVPVTADVDVLVAGVVDALDR